MKRRGIQAEGTATNRTVEGEGEKELTLKRDNCVFQIAINASAPSTLGWFAKERPSRLAQLKISKSSTKMKIGG
jgi:hypothetical protein